MISLKKIFLALTIALTINTTKAQIAQQGACVLAITGILYLIIDNPIRGYIDASNRDAAKIYLKRILLGIGCCTTAAALHFISKKINMRDQIGYTPPF